MHIFSILIFIMYTLCRTVNKKLWKGYSFCKPLVNGTWNHLYLLDGSFKARDSATFPNPVNAQTNVLRRCKITEIHTTRKCSVIIGWQYSLSVQIYLSSINSWSWRLHCSRYKKEYIHQALNNLQHVCAVLVDPKGFVFLRAPNFCLSHPTFYSVLQLEIRQVLCFSAISYNSTFVWFLCTENFSVDDCFDVC